MELIGFIPARGGSERVKHKNTRPFAGFQNGLLELKLLQFKNVPEFDRIIVSSNDDAVLEFATRFSKEQDARVESLPRPDEYGVSATSMEQFIRDYIAHLRQEGHLFWSHVTHPFATSSVYRDAIAAYQRALDEGYDSLVSATKIQKFLWRDGKPFNYDNTVEKWPRSQDIPPVYEINHAIYAIAFSVMRSTGDRIGSRPLMWEMAEADGMDIDWEDQFLLMEEIAQARLARGASLL